MNYPKVAVGLQVRTGSLRLPNKALRTICGRTMFDWTLDAIQQLPASWQKFVLTTDLGRDDVLASRAAERGFSVIRGDEDDVLSRYFSLADQVDADYYIRATGDNPLADAQLVEEALNIVSRQDADYLSCFIDADVPYGIGMNVISRKAMNSLRTLELTEFEKEHVEPALRRVQDLKLVTFKSESWPEYSSAFKMTVDTEADLDRVKQLALASKGNDASLRVIVESALLRKCIVFAQGAFGKNSLESLFQRGFRPRLIVTDELEVADFDYLVKKYDDSTKVISNMASHNLRESCRDHDAYLVFTLWSSHIFSEEEISAVPLGIFNLHNSLLPQHRGSGANIWAIIEHTDSGASLHRVTKELDKGPVIDRTPIKVDFGQTGESLFWEQLEKMNDLLMSNAERLFDGDYQYLETEGSGCYHSKTGRDILKNIKVFDNSPERRLLDALRAYSFREDGMNIELENGEIWVAKIQLRRSDANCE